MIISNLCISVKFQDHARAEHLKLCLVWLWATGFLIAQARIFDFGIVQAGAWAENDELGKVYHWAFGFLIPLARIKEGLIWNLKDI